MPKKSSQGGLVVSSVVTRDPRDLKQHSVNIELYGEDLPEHLVESIRDFGIREPIRVCRSEDPKLNNVIVSGRRRRNIAIKEGIKEVPTVEWECNDELQLVEELIIANIRSELTMEHRMRQYDKLKEIAAQRAEQRMKSGKKSDPAANLPEGESSPVAEAGAASAIAAKQVGVSRKTAEAGAKVIQKIDELKEEGKTEEAESLTQELNRSVHGAAVSIGVVKSPQRGKQTCQKCEVVCELSHEFCHGCGELLPRRPDALPDPLPKDKFTREIEECMRRIDQHFTGYVSNRVKMIKAIDAKHKACPTFGRRFKKLEALMTGLGEASEGAEHQVKGLKEHWAKVRADIGDQ